MDSQFVGYIPQILILHAVHVKMGILLPGEDHDVA